MAAFHKSSDRKFLFFLSAAGLLLSICSCSLNYTQESNTEDVVPEFKFDDMSLKRYSKNKIDMEISADSMEQYKNNGGDYATNATFKTWDEDGTLKTTGGCSLLGINSADKIYVLFNNIIINNLKDDLEIRATSLKYDDNTEQLVSGLNDTVFIKRSDIEIEGSGFSASGVSQSFAFDSLKSGLIDTDNNSDVSSSPAQENITEQNHTETVAE